MTNPLRRQVPSHVCINGFILWYVVTVHQCDDTARMFLCQGLLLQRNQHHRGGQRAGRSQERLSDSSSPCQPHLRAAARLASTSSLLLLAKYSLASLDIFSLCLLDYYFFLFLFFKAFEANGSSKGCSARSVFVTIKGCFT